MIGKTVSHYKILEKLGEGGMGVVYKAEDTRLKRPVALKFLPPDLTRDDEAKTRFTHEAQAASALQHPNICTIHDIDETADHQLFIVMDCYEGQTLKQRIEYASVPIDTAIDIATQVAQGLAKAHDSGIVHRDIKPANIIVGEDGTARILDFGLAKLSNQTVLTKSGSTLGTVAYMSPEQARGDKVDRRTDIWSLGVVLYETVTGHLPFKSEYEQALMYSLLNETPDAMVSSRKDVPIALERVVAKCLEKDPSCRYQSAGEFLSALRDCKDERAQVAQSVFGQMFAHAIWGRKKWTRRVLLVGVPMVLILAWFLVSRYFGAPSEPIPIAVISFGNLTGDSTYTNLQEAIPNLLITKLEQSSYLRVTTWERLRDLSKQLGKGGSSFIDSELGFELAQRDSARALIKGTYVKAGNVFAIDVKIYDVNTKKMIKSATSKGEGPGSVYDQIDDLGRQISSGFGILASAASAEVKPIKEVTTSSMEAYNYFLRGRQDVEEYLPDRAVGFLRKATELDSTFAMAHYYLAGMYGQTEDGKQALEKAARHAKTASAKEQLLIGVTYASQIEHDQEKSYTLLMKLKRQFPKDKRVLVPLGVYFDQRQEFDSAAAYFNRALALDPSYEPALRELGSLNLVHFGEYEKSLEYFRRSAAASPGYPNPFDNLGEVYFFMGKLDSAILQYDEAKRVEPSWTMISDSKLSCIDALKEDYGSAFRRLESLQAQRGWAPLASTWESFLHSWLGERVRARRELDMMLRTLRKTDAVVEGSLVNQDYWFLGALAFSLDQPKAARWCFSEHARLGRAATPKDSAKYAARLASANALIDLRLGHLQSAQSELAVVRSSLPSLRDVSRGYLEPLVHNAEAELLLANGQVDSAIAHWLKQPPLTYFHFMYVWPEGLAATNILFPRDGLARAYAMKGDLEAAIREYERITRFDPSSRDRRFIHPLHRYELAKLYEQKNLKEQAIAEYERFLTLWKNADRDRPEPRDAKKQLAKLAGKNPRREM